MMKKKKGGESCRVSGGIRPHFSEVLNILVPNEMLELSGGLPHRKECTLGSSTVVPEQYDSFGALIILPGSKCHVNIDGVYFHFLAKDTS